MREYKVIANIKYGRDCYLNVGEIYDLDSPEVSAEIKTTLEQMIKAGSKFITLYRGVAKVPVYTPQSMGVVDPVHGGTYTEEETEEEIEAGRHVSDGSAPLKPKR